MRVEEAENFITQPRAICCNRAETISVRGETADLRLVHHSLQLSVDVDFAPTVPPLRRRIIKLRPHRPASPNVKPSVWLCGIINCSAKIRAKKSTILFPPMKNRGKKGSQLITHRS